MYKEKFTFCLSTYLSAQYLENLSCRKSKEMKVLGAFGQTVAVCMQKMSLNLDGLLITTTEEKTNKKMSDCLKR